MKSTQAIGIAQLFLFILLAGCARVEKYLPNQVTIKEAPGHKVKVTQDVIVQAEGEEAQKLNAGSEIIVKDKATYIHSPGYIGTLILPPGEAPAEVEVSLKQSANWASEGTKSFASKRITEVLGEVSQIHELLYLTKYTEALGKVREVKRQYSDITYLSFLEASTLVLMNRQQEAIPLLRQSLKVNPEMNEARDLLRTIASEPGSGQ